MTDSLPGEFQIRMNNNDGQDLATEPMSNGILPRQDSPMEISRHSPLLDVEGDHIDDDETVEDDDLTSQHTNQSTEDLRKEGSGILKKYTSTNDNKKLYRCQHCRYITDRKNNLKRHVVTMHETCTKTLECCDVVFKNKASLRDHVLSCHKNGYDCRICGRTFCRKALLKRHITVHSGQKDYICSVCGYATSHKSNLDRHKRRHGPKYAGMNGYGSDDQSGPLSSSPPHPGPPSTHSPVDASRCLPNSTNFFSFLPDSPPHVHSPSNLSLGLAAQSGRQRLLHEPKPILPPPRSSLLHPPAPPIPPTPLLLPSHADLMEAFRPFYHAAYRPMRYKLKTGIFTKRLFYTYNHPQAAKWSPASDQPTYIDGDEPNLTNSMARSQVPPQDEPINYSKRTYPASSNVTEENKHQIPSTLYSSTRRLVPALYKCGLCHIVFKRQLELTEHAEKSHSNSTVSSESTLQRPLTIQARPLAVI